MTKRISPSIGQNKLRAGGSILIRHRALIHNLTATYNTKRPSSAGGRWAAASKVDRPWHRPAGSRAVAAAFVNVLPLSRAVSDNGVRIPQAGSE